MPALEVEEEAQGQQVSRDLRQALQADRHKPVPGHSRAEFEHQGLVGQVNILMTTRVFGCFYYN